MNVVDLGLIYGVTVEDSRVHVTMTMTTPACPMGTYLTECARQAVRNRVPEAADVEVELVWDPPWHPGMMSETAKEHFGWSEG